MAAALGCLLLHIWLKAVWAVHLRYRDFITSISWGVTHSPEKAVEGPMEHGLTKRWKIMQSALVLLLLVSWLWTIAINQSIYPSMHPFIHPPIHLSIYPSIHLSTHHSIHSSKILESTVCGAWSQTHEQTPIGKYFLILGQSGPQRRKRHPMAPQKNFVGKSTLY